MIILKLSCFLSQLTSQVSFDFKSNSIQNLVQLEIFSFSSKFEKKEPFIVMIRIAFI